MGYQAVGSSDSPRQAASPRAPCAVSPIIIVRAGYGLIFRGLDVEGANQAGPPFQQVFGQAREQRRPVAIIVAACIP
jgi:hypothetical protein